MLGILVVTWNSAETIDGCLAACAEVPDESRVLVVDNASGDDTAMRARKHLNAKVVVNSRNKGFAGAVNQGFRELSDCSHVLLINPDAVLHPEGVSSMLELARQRSVGAVGGRLAYPDGRDQHGFNVRRFPGPWTLAFEVLGINRLWPGNPVNRRYRQPNPQEFSSEVEQPAGAFLMISRSAWQHIGGFDERFYPVWFEDVDFCLRLRQAGYRILYCSAAVAAHAGGASAALLPWSSRQLFWYGSLLKFSSRHFSRWGRRSVVLAVMLGCVLRMIVATIDRQSAEAIGVYSKVFYSASSYWRGSPEHHASTAGA